MIKIDQLLKERNENKDDSNNKNEEGEDSDEKNEKAEDLYKKNENSEYSDEKYKYKSSKPKHIV